MSLPWPEPDEPDPELEEPELVEPDEEEPEFEEEVCPCEPLPVGCPDTAVSAVPVSS